MDEIKSYDVTYFQRYENDYVDAKGNKGKFLRLGRGFINKKNPDAIDVRIDLLPPTGFTGKITLYPSRPFENNREGNGNSAAEPEEDSL